MRRGESWRNIAFAFILNIGDSNSKAPYIKNCEIPEYRINTSLKVSGEESRGKVEPFVNGRRKKTNKLQKFPR